MEASLPKYETGNSRLTRGLGPERSSRGLGPERSSNILSFISHKEVLRTADQISPLTKENLEVDDLESVKLLALCRRKRQEAKEEDLHKKILINCCIRGVEKEIDRRLRESFGLW